MHERAIDRVGIVLHSKQKIGGDQNRLQSHLHAAFGSLSVLPRERGNLHELRNLLFGHRPAVKPARQTGDYLRRATVLIWIASENPLAAGAFHLRRKGSAERNRARELVLLRRI